MEPACDRRLELFVVAKTISGGQEFLEVQENVNNPGSKIRAPIDLAELTMNFNRRNAFSIQELYHRPNLASGGRRYKSLHFGPVLSRYWNEARPVRLAYD
ncbi:hypothetical protein TNCV_3825251 [Trichonephila clavipes]|nr:hypothetical protein TNCV_3825251 [Trichonephila clavipes]